MTQEAIKANAGQTADKYQQKWLSVLNKQQTKTAKAPAAPTQVVQAPAAAPAAPASRSPDQVTRQVAAQTVAAIPRDELPLSYTSALAMNYLADTDPQGDVMSKVNAMVEEMRGEEAGTTGGSVLQKYAQSKTIDPFQFVMQQEEEQPARRPVPRMPKMFAEGGEVDYNQLGEQMTVGTLPEQTAPSPVDTAVNDYVRMQSKILTDPKEWVRNANQRLISTIEQNPEEFVTGFTGQGIAGIIRRPGGTFMTNPKSEFNVKMSEALSGLEKMFIENPEKQKAVTNMFTKKALDFFSKRAGTVDDELKRVLIDGRMRIPGNDELFPKYLVEAAKKGDFAAVRDLERRYDDMIGVKGALRVEEGKSVLDSDIRNKIKQDLLRSYKENPDLMPDDLLYRLTNKNPTEVRNRIRENPEFFSTAVEPKLSQLINPKVETVSARDVTEYPSLYGRFKDPNANELEAMRRGEVMYDIPNLMRLFGPRLDEFAEQAMKMGTKELQEDTFPTLFKKAFKLIENQKNLSLQAEKIVDAFAKNKTPDVKLLSYGTKPFLPTKDDFVWKKVVDPDATIVQAAALNNSIAGYSRYGAYGPFNNGRKALDDGTVELYVLYNNKGIPVTNVEVTRGAKAGEKTFRQVFGNGPRTGNVMPEDYLPQVRDLINEVKPREIPFGLSEQFRNNPMPFAKGGMVDKPLYDRAA
jgi:hypothetical protein